jgi:formylglycine-generating enzyme required for sulfatase activity
VLDKLSNAFDHKDESIFPHPQFEKSFGIAVSKEEVISAMKEPTFEKFLFQVVVTPAKGRCNNLINLRIKRSDTREYYGSFGLSERKYSSKEIDDPSIRSTRHYSEAITKIKELLKMGVPVQANVQLLNKGVSNFHSVALDGYRLACNKETCREFVRLKNSWGKEWQDDHSGGWVDAQILFNNLPIFEWIYPTDKAPLTEVGKVSQAAWAEWQASMQRAYEALKKKTQEKRVTPSDFDQFFVVYAADNTWSDDAKLLREKARNLMTSDSYSKRRSTAELFPTFKDCDKCPSMTILPQRGFVMGGVDEGGQIAPRKKPQHFVEIKRFALSTTPITYDEWDTCVEDHACNNYKPDDGGKGRGKRPVDSVSRYDAEAYIRWLNTKAKGSETYRLPTTAEWEYAQRGGTSTPYYAGNSIADLEPYEIFKTAEQLQLSKKQRRKGAVSVASKKPNPFGLYDMAGNIRGWAADCFDEKTGNTDYIYSHFNSSTKFPLLCTGKGTHTYNIIRGGFWGSIDDTQSASYDFLESKERFPEIGFRVAKSIGD